MRAVAASAMYAVIQSAHKTNFSTLASDPSLGQADLQLALFY